MITPGKRSRPPDPVEGGVEHRREPLKVQLEYLRNRLAEHPDQPTPDLYRALQELINWALWRIDRPLTRGQIRYQRAFIVGVPRELLKLAGKEIRLVAAVGSALLFGDDVPGQGAATIR